MLKRYRREKYAASVFRPHSLHVGYISTSLHGNTSQKTVIFEKLVNYEVHNLYTLRLLLFIYGLFSNALNNYLELYSFIFGRLRVPVATCRAAILTETLADFTQSLQASCGIVPKTRPRPLPTTCMYFIFIMHYHLST